jgi:hypothetical protein
MPAVYVFLAGQSQDVSLCCATIAEMVIIIIIIAAAAAALTKRFDFPFRRSR